MDDLRLLQFYFLFLILTCEVLNWAIFNLKCYIESFYIDIILKQNKFTILPLFLVKILKGFFYFFNNEIH